MISRTISGAIALAYLIVAYFTGDGATIFRLALYLVLALACIWYSDAMGDYVGPFGRHAITQTTPGCFVAAGGWFLLFLPVIALLIMFGMMGSSNQ